MNKTEINLETGLDNILRAFMQDLIDAKNEENRIAERMLLAREREVENNERLVNASVESLAAGVRFIEAQIKTMEKL